MSTMLHHDYRGSPAACTNNYVGHRRKQETPRRSCLDDGHAMACSSQIMSTGSWAAPRRSTGINNTHQAGQVATNSMQVASTGPARIPPGDINNTAASLAFQLGQQQATSLKPHAGHRRRSKRRIKKRSTCAAQPGQCDFCGRTNNPPWRKGPEGIYDRLCNTCGIQFMRRGMDAFTHKLLAKRRQQQGLPAPATPCGSPTTLQAGPRTMASAPASTLPKTPTISAILELSTRRIKKPTGKALESAAAASKASGRKRKLREVQAAVEATDADKDDDSSASDSHPSSEDSDKQPTPKKAKSPSTRSSAPAAAAMDSDRDRSSSEAIYTPSAITALKGQSSFTAPPTAAIEAANSCQQQLHEAQGQQVELELVNTADPTFTGALGTGGVPMLHRLLGVRFSPKARLQYQVHHTAFVGHQASVQAAQGARGSGSSTLHVADPGDNIPFAQLPAAVRVRALQRHDQHGCHITQS